MSYHDKLVTEIADVFEQYKKDNKPLNPSWIAHEVCQGHVGGLNEGSEHADFWKHGGYYVARRETTRYLNGKHGDSESNSAEVQYAFPGFKRIQPHYVVERDEQLIGVETLLLTDDEIEAKIKLYRSYGAASYEHADELARFKIWRRALPAVAAQ